MRRLRLNPSLLVGGLIVGTLGGLAIIGPKVIQSDPLQIDLAQVLVPPQWSHPFGCDSLGRDVLTRVIWGLRYSLAVATAVVTSSVIIGTIIGALAALSHRLIDEVIMRLVDVLLAFPGILLALALAAILGPGLPELVLALCAIGWTGYARLVRAEILTLRERDYVLAARALGSGPVRIFWNHILPALWGPLIVRASFGLAGIIVAETALSFLGLGAKLPTPTLGNMLDEGRAFLLVAPNLTLAPGVTVGLLVLGFNLLGDGLAQGLG